MDTAKIYEKLLGHFGEGIILGLTEADDAVKDPFITVRGDKVDRVGLFCKVEPALACDFLQSITGMDTAAKMAVLRDKREGAYEALKDAVYARRGWTDDGVPTVAKVKDLGIDFDEVLELIGPHQ